MYTKNNHDVIDAISKNGLTENARSVLAQIVGTTICHISAKDADMIIKITLIQKMNNNITKKTEHTY